MKKHEKFMLLIAAIAYTILIITLKNGLANKENKKQLEQQLEYLQQVQNDTQDEIKLLESRILLLNEKTAILDEIKAYEINIAKLDYSIVNENYSGIYKVTAYNNDTCGKTPEHKAYGITASGKPTQEWLTIAAGLELPFGAKVYIPEFMDKPNNGIFEVQDRGDKWITEGEIDVYMESYEDCIKHGIKYLQCYVLQ